MGSAQFRDQEDVLGMIGKAVDTKTLIHIPYYNGDSGIFQTVRAGSSFGSK
jgi:hypothetical protein